MTREEFITKWTGKPVDFDGIYPNQCMDLMHQYAYDVLGITDKAVLAKPWAAQVYTQFSWDNYFERIGNTATGVPQAGDIILWEEALNYDDSVKHGFGHVAIVIEANVKSFKSFDANWPTGSLPHIQQHDNYAHVLGWLRPKIQVTTGALNTHGLDANNPSSVQAVYDAWYSLSQGNYVSKSDVEKDYVKKADVAADIQANYVHLADVNAICTTLGIPSGSNKDAINVAIVKLQNDKGTAEKNNENLNKQIPDLEKAARDAKTAADAAEALAYNEAGQLYKELFTTADENLIKVRNDFAEYQKTQNRSQGQTNAVDYSKVDTSTLVSEVFRRWLHLK